MTTAERCGRFAVGATMISRTALALVAVAALSPGSVSFAQGAYEIQVYALAVSSGRSTSPSSAR